MNQTKFDKVLVLVDGSKRSVQTVKYLAALPAMRDATVNLFHVFSHVPDSHYDLAMEPSSIPMGGRLIAWEKSRRNQIQNHMEKSRKILLAADFHPQRVHITVQDRRNGIARDIIAESGGGYDAVILRRRGTSKLASLVMGSVAFKLVSGLGVVPLVFAGRKPYDKRVLVGVDPSEGAMRAVDFVGRIAAGHDYTLGLVSVLRSGWTPEKASTDLTDADGGPKEAVGRMEATLARAVDRLVAAGCRPGDITTQIITDAHSRAGAIVAAAERDDYSTIAAGRRGTSQVSQFSIGRVANKLLHVGRRHHVWIVS